MATKKRLTEKEEIIRDIVSSLKRCPTTQLIFMYELMGIMAGAALEITRAAEKTGTQLAIKLVEVEAKTMPSGQQSEFKN